MEKLFNEANFVYEYRKELECFFRPYFDDEQSMYSFFISVFRHDDKDKTPRRIMNQINRYISLSNDIEKIRPGRDSLRVLFLRILLESIYGLTSSVNQGKIKDFFKHYMSKEGQQYILDSFKFSYLKVHERNSCEEICVNDYSNHVLSIEDFSQIFYKIRGKLVHEGDYWSMQFFARDDHRWITDFTTSERTVTFYTPPKGCEVTYVFHTTLKYEIFIRFFADACIRFLNEYIETKAQEYAEQ